MKREMRAAARRLKAWWADRTEGLPTEVELRQAIDAAVEVEKMTQSPGWKIYVAEVEKLIGVETTVWQEADATKVMSVAGVALQQNRRGMVRALGVVELIKARGADALERLASHRFRG